MTGGPRPRLPPLKFPPNYYLPISLYNLTRFKVKISPCYRQNETTQVKLFIRLEKISP
jgi:hypothetical protein